MSAKDDSDDILAIEAVITRQFGTMNWSPENPLIGLHSPPTSSRARHSFPPRALQGPRQSKPSSSA